MLISKPDHALQHKRFLVQCLDLRRVLLNQLLEQPVSPDLLVFLLKHELFLLFVLLAHLLDLSFLFLDSLSVVRKSAVVAVFTGLMLLSLMHQEVAQILLKLTVVLI